MGHGLAWGDYDNDGDLDLFLPNFKGSLLNPPLTAEQEGRCALYQNNGDGTFLNVAADAGVDFACYGIGAGWCDFDNDNDLDLYVTTYGPNALFLNHGDGTFKEISHEAGVGDDHFGAGCAWGDFDQDGYVDLYVCNYVEFNIGDTDRTQSTRHYGSEIPYTINPSSYQPVANRLYRNLGDGTFTDVGDKAGVSNPSGRSLGAIWFDFDNDGLLDLYVANDVSANGVFRNLGDGTFADIGASSLAADYRGAMGMAVGDFEHDGDLDLFVTHWIAQENAFFENMISEDLGDDSGKTRLFFMDTAEFLGLGHISLKTVGWSTGLTDFDNDGSLDLWVVNGNTLEKIDDHTRLKPQPTHLFWHKPGSGFFEIGAHACPRLRTPIVGRGGAAADYDGDGRRDLVIAVHSDKPILLRNTTENDHHWLVIRLRQLKRNTRALGAVVRIRTGEKIQMAQVGADGSYLSQHDTDVHFGLGKALRVDEILITWPDGATQIESSAEVDQVLTILRQ